MSFVPGQLIEMYRGLPSESREHRHVEQILGLGISFFASLLEHPGVWDVEALAEGG